MQFIEQFLPESIRTTLFSPFVYIIVGAILLLLVFFAIVKKVKRNKKIKSPSQQEQNNPVEQTKPSVIEQEEVGIFMPVPAVVSEVIRFVGEKDLGFPSLLSMKAEEVNEQLSNEKANALVSLVYKQQEEVQEKAVLYLDTLGEQFQCYSFINLSILKKYGIVGKEVNYITIYARGILSKALMIEANEFSLEAVKQLSLVGGKAIMILDKQKQNNNL